MLRDKKRILGKRRKKKNCEEYEWEKENQKKMRDKKK